LAAWGAWGRIGPRGAAWGAGLHDAWGRMGPHGAWGMRRMEMDLQDTWCLRWPWRGAEWEWG
jgi:hypothetical protein